MTFQEITKIAERQVPSVYVDSWVSRKHRRAIRGILVFSALAFFILSIFSKSFVFDGLALLFFSIYVLARSFEFFYDSSRFVYLRTRLHESILDSGLEYPMVLVLAKTLDTDLTKGLLESVPGRTLLFRLGISTESVQKYINSDRPHISDTSINQSLFNVENITFGNYAEIIYNADRSLQAFLASNSVNSQEFLATSVWIGYEIVKEMRQDRWWSKENLHSISSIGSGLDYGKAYELSKYGVNINNPFIFFDLDINNGYRDREVNQLENILVRHEEANALLIDDDESIVKDIVLRLWKRMRTGKAFFAIESKTIVELDWKSLVADNKTKQELESEILMLLRSSESAGNIIIYIANLPAFMTSVKPLGVNLTSLFENFLKSIKLQVIAHSTKVDFHYFIETNPSLLQLFERVIPESVKSQASLGVVVERARRMEAEYDIFFSYPALISITELGERYITYGEMPSKAIDLLVEISSWARENHIKFLNKQDVVAFIGNKTGVSIGMPDKAESDKLASLESILHERIIGQNEAVSSVASALRRVRSGITNPKRPFASFLFLGPTGVGKTETSKALAESFFGEGKLIRFDMSEYKEADALPTLLGSSSELRTGLLASKVRDNPYGVLLLDEFEKASPDVRDLFLQVLDEGEFSDALGNKVNCRNLIIIATSNAGADMIWKMVEEKIDLNKNKEIIINNLIENRILKPELINRFDATVIFHPLISSELVQVAQIMFDNLRERLSKEKNIDVSIDPDLLNSLVSENNDKEFGARAINRLIQEKVEDVIARKILSGEIKAGDSIEIKAKDVS